MNSKTRREKEKALQRNAFSGFMIYSHSISPGKHYIHYNSKVPKNANSASGSAKKGANVCLIIALCGTLLNTKKFSSWWRR